MVFEVAHTEILAGKQRKFEAAVQQALPLFTYAKGCHYAELHHLVERDTSCVLLVRRNTVENHMVGFRESDDFQEWCKSVGSFFAKAPEVVHSEVAVKQSTCPESFDAHPSTGCTQRHLVPCRDNNLIARSFFQGSGLNIP